MRKLGVPKSGLSYRDQNESAERVGWRCEKCSATGCVVGQRRVGVGFTFSWNWEVFCKGLYFLEQIGSRERVSARVCTDVSAVQPFRKLRNFFLFNSFCFLFSCHWVSRHATKAGRSRQKKIKGLISIKKRGNLKSTFFTRIQTNPRKNCIDGVKNVTKPTPSAPEKGDSRGGVSFVFSWNWEDFREFPYIRAKGVENRPRAR